MKTLNLKEFFGSTVLAFNPDGRTTVERRSNDGHLRRHLPVGLTKLLSLLFLLTLATGQMWADAFWPYAGFYEVYMTYSYNGNNSNYTFYASDNNSSQSVDLGTLTADFKVTALYMKCYKNTNDWNKSGNICGALMIYNTGSGDNEYQPTWSGYDTDKGWDDGYQAHKRELTKTSCNKVIASYNSGASGSYTAKLAFKMWGSDDNGSDCGDIWWISNNSNNYKFKYKIAPPAVKSGTLSVSATNVVSGTGTEGDPFVITYGSTTQFTVSGTQDHTDANSSIKGGFGTSTISSSATSSAYTPTTSVQSLTIYGAYVNSTTSSLKGASSNKTIYYKWADPAVPTLSMSSVSPTTLVEGNTVTINVTRSNSSAAISYEYKIGDGSWTSLTPASTSNNGQTATWAIPEAHGAMRTFYFRATMSDGGTKTTAASDPVTVYGKKTIHVKNTNNWTYVYLYTYNSATNGSFPGKTGAANGAEHTAGQWWDITITSQSANFILSSGNSSGGPQTSDLTYTSFTDGSCYSIGSGGGTSLTLTSTTAPTVPTVTTADATVSSSTRATFSATVTNFGNDKTTYGVAYYKNATAPAAATIYSSGTKSQINNNVTANNTSGNTGAQTITAGANYWYVAYALNGQASGAVQYGTVKCVRTTAITLNNQEATTAGTASVVGVNGKAMPDITKPAKTGYTFGGYFTEPNGGGTKYYNADGTSAANWPSNQAAAVTLYAKWTANKYDVTLNTNGGTNNSQVVEATYGQAMPTTLKAGGAIAATTKTGYTFDGYWYSTTQYYTAGMASAHTWNRTAATTLTAKWNANTYTLTLHKNDGSDNSSNETATYDATISVSAPTRTGYTFTGYWTTASGDGTKIIDTDGHFVASVTDYTGAGKIWHRTSNTDLYARWTANNYDVTLKANTGTGDDQLVQATFDAAMPTTLKVGGSAVTVHTKTGYTLLGYWDAASGGNQYYSYNAGTSTLTSFRTWDKAANTYLYAHWQANTFTVNFNANGGTGTMTAESFTYDATEALPANRFTRDGYHFDGWATAADGEVIYADGAEGCRISSTDGASVTLYAHWTRCEITGLTFEPTSAAGNTSVSVTANISPTPISGTAVICWKLYNNSTLTSEESTTFTPASGATVSFTTPATSGTYYVQATLRTGSSCGSGDVISTLSRPYAVASAHTVTVRYMCDGVEIASRTEKVIPAAATYDFDAPDITGYTFSSWTLGDVLETGDALTANPITVSAVYDGVLTANYTKKNMIYFNNTLGWDDVWVYFYTSEKYWSDDYGTGAWKGQYFTGSRPYYEMHRGHMTQIEGTDIWYFDYTAQGWDGWKNVAFTNMGDKSGYDATNNNNNAPDDDHAYFSNTAENPIQVVRRGDHKTSLPMFVPLTGITPQKKNNNKAEYYFEGCWMNYPENTGYTLYIFNTNASNGIDHSEIKHIDFGHAADNAMPVSITTDLEAGQTYGFKIKRADGSWYGNSGTMTNGHSGDGSQTVWEFKTGTENDCGLTTSGAGDYKFTLSFGLDADNTNYNYHVAVHYPEATGDFRVQYKDNAKSTWKTSAVIPAGTEADTVSYFVRKNQSPYIRVQKCTATYENGETTVTWANVNSGNNIISTLPSAITRDSVYNFIFTKSGDNLVLSKVEPYSGNYYIRTDAANNKWDNFRAADHQMTYSEYADKNSDFTHYWMAFVTSGTNVKCVVANDYSTNISDTLIVSDFRGGDASHIYNNVDGHNNGDIQADANIRFMWNRGNNRLVRAYLAAAKEDGTKFLVLQGEAEKLLDENGSALSGESKEVPGNNHGAGDNAIQFVDKENWLYETTVKVKPSSYVKLYANFHGGNFYYKGDETATFDEEHAIQLIGGDAESAAQKIRVVYDFKTDRLIAAWMPSNEAITASTPINADVMVVRSHQEAAQNITFDGGSLTDVKTVYGVMQFNRWTLNNRAGAEDIDPEHCKTADLIALHHGMRPANEWLSDYERFNYYISFPFDVKVGEIFGFGTYGTHWVLRYYDGLNRAKNGYWIDTDPNWKYITNTDSVLHAFQGYLLSLSPSRMAYNNTDVWKNNSSIIELYFPSKVEFSTISAHDHTLDALSEDYKCTINRGDGTDGDRRVKDSYWRCIGVPGFADYSQTLTGDNGTIDWKNADYSMNWDTKNLGYIYEWNANTNGLTVASVADMKHNFKAMHAYLVQYPGAITWTNVNAPSAIVARQRDENPARSEWKLTVEQNGQMIDRTYVRISNEEDVTTGFDFGTDLSKEINAGRTNIYTLIGYEKAAANCLPMNNQTTVVPMGVQIAADGEYTFAMPDGTNGTGVTLIDNETGTRTSLALTDYTVTLGKGTYDNRFVLEFSPVAQTPTGIGEVASDQVPSAKARKVLIDGIMYIVRDGEVFDARGTKVK